ncbi:MAG TPA: hypothetical protein PKV72_00785 [Candidatus Peribacteria bacterium]|nr:hypothetical protein [Candidatus Peribacteria bacterium]
MRSILVFFDAPAPDGYPFTSDEYRRSYREFALLLRKRGARFFVARGPQAYAGGNAFTSGWEYGENGELVVHPGKIVADVIYNKGHLACDRLALVINTPELDALCTDKKRTADLLPEISAHTRVVRSAADLDRALQSLSTPRIVAKPVDGEGGDGVYIGTKEEVRVRVKHFPYLLQDFIDTDAGIPGIVEGSHDFRMLCVRGKLIQAFIRTPPPGGLLPNVAQGGSTHEVPLEKVPESAMEIFRLVDARLSRFADRVYSVDLGLHRGKVWKLFELNSRPALFSCERGEGFARFHEALADVLLTATA